VAFPAQSAQRGAASTSRRMTVRAMLAFPIIQFGAMTDRFAGAAFGRRWKADSGPARLGQADGNGLLGGTSPVLPFPDMMDFFADELPGLRGGRSAAPLVVSSALHGCVCGHRDSVSFLGNSHLVFRFHVIPPSRVDSPLRQQYPSRPHQAMPAKADCEVGQKPSRISFLPNVASNAPCLLDKRRGTHSV
jgi:hypothetical protein